MTRATCLVKVTRCFWVHCSMRPSTVMTVTPFAGGDLRHVDEVSTRILPTTPCP